MNDERTVFVRMWGSGAVEAAIRFDRGATWGPPVALVEEKV